MTQAAPEAIVDAAYAVLNAAGGLAGNGSKERAHPFPDDQQRRWFVEWDDERMVSLLQQEYDCELTLAFVAHATGEGANAAVGQMRTAAQAAIAASSKLSNIVERIRVEQVGREVDDQGRSISGTLRLVFAVAYQADMNGALLPRT